MSLIQRFCSKLLDYLWFWSILLIMMDLLSLGIAYILGVTLFLPLLFIPIEAVCIALFRTTLGKIIFGIRYKEKLSLKKAFVIAAKKGVWTLPLFVPIVNLFFAYFFIFDPRKTGGRKETRLTNAKLIYDYPRRFVHLLLIAFAFILSLFCFVPDTIFDPLERIANIEKPGFFKNKGLGLFSSGDWIQVTHEENLFTVFFPKAPKYVEETHAVPSSDVKLTYKEYSHKDDLHYSLGYTDLPSSWTKWGSSLVLKGALKVLTEKKGKIVYKKITVHDAFPAIEYQLNTNGKIAIGKLILVGKTLYRIEILQSEMITEEEKLAAQKFFHSFHPEKRT